MLNFLKKGLCFVLAAVLLCGLVGCVSTAVHTPYSLSQKILSLCSDEISWTSLNRQQAATYYGLSGDFPESFAAYISDDDTRFDAVAVFTFKTQEQKKALADCFAQVLNSNKTSVGLVNENETNKILNSVVLELDGMLILVAVENAQDVSLELQKIGAKNYVY